MDLKKEIKLADLIPKRSAFKRSGKPVSAPKRQTMPPELVGLKIEAGSLSAAQIVNNGSKKLVRIAQAPLGQGIVNARRSPRSGRTFERPERLLQRRTTSPVAAFGSGLRTAASVFA